jgi:hypothetical protein
MPRSTNKQNKGTTSACLICGEEYNHTEPVKTKDFFGSEIFIKPDSDLICLHCQEDLSLSLLSKLLRKDKK